MMDPIFLKLHNMPPSCPDRADDIPDYFARLVRSFHVLQDCPKDILLPRFKPQAFDKWVVSIAHDEYAVLQAGAFILQTWNDTCGPYMCGPFNLWGALGSWDFENRRAFAYWAADSWRP